MPLNTSGLPAAVLDSKRRRLQKKLDFAGKRYMLRSSGPELTDGLVRWGILTARSYSERTLRKLKKTLYVVSSSR